MDTLITHNITKLSAQLGQALKEKQFTLALAESCTGGLASAAITDISGSSTWFDRGFITYSNTAKQEMLGVPKKPYPNMALSAKKLRRQWSWAHSIIVVQILQVALPVLRARLAALPTSLSAWFVLPT